MTTTSKQDMLSDVFESVGTAHGYETIEVKYIRWRNFRVKWERKYKEIKIQASDYLSFADRDTLEEFAERLFSRIEGSKGGYGPLMKGYVLSDYFLNKVQPLYVKRSRGFDRAEGSVEDRLYKSIARLEMRGLYPDVKDIVFYWTDERMKKAGYCACLPKVIAISSELNCDACPDYVLDYLVYHFAITVKIGREIFGGDRDLDREVEVAETKYEGKDAAVRWIRAMGLYL